ncbi:MAG: DUF2294 domain-containing protein [Jaaginema sp. PMC 1079.18]|nr:DUF2294 domain-containing protein [Jaaginema sp. PMC 1080.18]MEC4852535.1 DUF2294 domain-containing protein [Jaaginema sp. PMC 1079.18]MEC4865655.1 DUF2294 domain-containing protein [Jaaginema sp. PMC 1078.18]
MKPVKPTRGQLERQISQKIQGFYRDKLGHQPSKVTCQIFDTKIAIVLEDSVTPTEQILNKEGREDLAEQVRSSLDEATRPPLKKLIQDVVGIKILDLLSDATVDTGRTGIIAILEDVPDVRTSEKTVRVKPKSSSET